MAWVRGHVRNGRYVRPHYRRSGGDGGALLLLALFLLPILVVVAVAAAVIVLAVQLSPIVAPVIASATRKAISICRPVGVIALAPARWVLSAWDDLTGQGGSNHPLALSAKLIVLCSVVIGGVVFLVWSATPARPVSVLPPVVGGETAVAATPNRQPSTAAPSSPLTPVTELLPWPRPRPPVTVDAEQPVAPIEPDGHPMPPDAWPKPGGVEPQARPKPPLPRTAALRPNGGVFWLAEDAPSLTAFVQAGPRSAVGQRLIAEKRVYQLAGPFEVKLVSQTELTVYVEVIFGPLAGRQLVTTRSSFAP